MTRPLIVSHSDFQGGAARAAWRLHVALVGNGVDSKMKVGSKASGDWRVLADSSSVGKAMARVRPVLDPLLSRLQLTDNTNLHSPAWLSGVSGTDLNNLPADVMNLHWVCGGFASIEQIAKITKPIVWTMHDMWAFCGAEHYAPDDPGARWRVGYRRDNRTLNSGGLDLDRWVWHRKRRLWANRMQIVCPSSWLARCVRDSALLSGCDVSVIPNALDTTVFKPIEKRVAREILNLDPNEKIILFGAIGGSQDARKGWDLLEPALICVANSHSNVSAIVFGQREPPDAPQLGMPVTWVGHVSDDVALAILYSAADVMIVPSRQENLPQSATEAQACGCPVVAFDVSGLPDAVSHGITGFLADCVSYESLTSAISWVLTDDVRRSSLSRNARVRAVELWDNVTVAKQYVAVYAEAAAKCKAG